MRLGLSLVIFVSFFCLVVGVAKAELSSGVATTQEVDDQSVVDGDILCHTKGKIQKCDQEYQVEIYGVYSDNPAVVLDDTLLVNGKYMLNSGKTEVRVSAVNGEIKKGDFITSSKVAGVGEKAIISGNVLGVSLGNYTSNDKSVVGKVLTQIDIRPAVVTSAETNILDKLKRGLLSPTLGPATSLRYVLAILIVIITLVLGFTYFGRVAKGGIEAIGRNPLASKTIALGVVFNATLILALMAAGLLLAYMVLII